MDDKILGWIILIGISLVGVLVIAKFGRRVVYPSAAIIRVWGAPKRVKNRPGFLLIPKMGKLLDMVLMPGDWQKLDLPLEEVLSADGVQVTLEIDLLWRIKFVESDDPKLEIGVMSPTDAIRFQASWKPGQFEGAVAQIVRSTAEKVIRRYRSTELGSEVVWNELSDKIEQILDRKGAEWGVDFDPNVVELQARAVVLATEAKVRAQIEKAQRMAEAEGLDEAVQYLRKSLGRTRHADDVIQTFLTQQKLRSLPAKTTLVNVGSDILGSLGGLIEQRVSEKKTRRRR